MVLTCHRVWKSTGRRFLARIWNAPIGTRRFSSNTTTFPTFLDNHSTCRVGCHRSPSNELNSPVRWIHSWQPQIWKYPWNGNSQPADGRQPRIYCMWIPWASNISRVSGDVDCYSCNSISNGFCHFSSNPCVLSHIFSIFLSRSHFCVCLSLSSFFVNLQRFTMSVPGCFGSPGSPSEWHGSIGWRTTFGLLKELSKYRIAFHILFLDLTSHHHARLSAIGTGKHQLHGLTHLQHIVPQGFHHMSADTKNDECERLNVLVC